MSVFIILRVLSTFYPPSKQYITSANLLNTSHFPLREFYLTIPSTFLPKNILNSSLGIFLSALLPLILSLFLLIFYIIDLIFWLHIVILFLSLVFQLKLLAFLFLQNLLHIVSCRIFSHLWTIYHPCKRHWLTRAIISLLSPISLDHNICFLNK